MNVEETLALATELAEFGGWVETTTRPEPNRVDFSLKSPGDLVPMVAGLRVKRLGFLSAITGLDPGPDTGQLEVLYHFCAGAAVITLRVRVPREAGAVPSLCPIIPGAEAYERELSEMFGVTVTGLPTPARLYLPDDWPAGVYPMRKDHDPQASPQAANGREAK
jgi:Ni,Fe-hydrogenase III component G